VDQDRRGQAGGTASCAELRAGDAVRRGCAVWEQASPCGGVHQAFRRLAFALCLRVAHQPADVLSPGCSPTCVRCARAAQDNAISAETVSYGLMQEDLREELELTELQCDAVLLGCVYFSMHLDSSRSDSARTDANVDQDLPGTSKERECAFARHERALLRLRSSWGLEGNPWSQLITSHMLLLCMHLHLRLRRR